MSKRQFFFGMLAASILGAIFTGIIILSFLPQYIETSNEGSISERQKISFTSFKRDSSIIVPKGLNFVNAAEKVIPGVVHIRAIYNNGEYSINPLEGFFRNPAQSSGSGVIVSDNGYIVTNYHVIENTSQIEVVLNDNRSFYAKVIGNDPTTDLALLKIDQTNLNFVKYGNSDHLKPGEWVLAIGNPFDLNSTVTAGIVSAKARNIGILRDRNNLQIESFIQTDAAVNPGNSGGALVNLNGELIGINTAIATPNGSYAGYSFAVPVTLVRKVMDDLLEFGEVQRGLLGIRIGDVNARLAESQGLNVYNGVFVSSVNENSAAADAGIKQGDVIVAIDGIDVNNVSELQELVARNRPGDQIEVTYIRENKKNEVIAILKNFEGRVELIRRTYSDEIEGTKFENLNDLDRSKFGITDGVKAVFIGPGKWKEAGVKEGFVIISIDKINVKDVEDLNTILENKKGGLLIEGYFKDGERGVFGIDW